jgi:hypothetical protein
MEAKIASGEDVSVISKQVIEASSSIPGAKEVLAVVNMIGSWFSASRAETEQKIDYKKAQLLLDATALSTLE